MSLSSIESITRSPSLSQAYQAHRVERSVDSKSTVGVGSQRIDLLLDSKPITVGIESITQSPSLLQSTYKPIEPIVLNDRPVTAYSQCRSRSLPTVAFKSTLIPTVESLNLIPTATLVYIESLNFDSHNRIELQIYSLHYV